jgi:hypothetical protein
VERQVDPLGKLFTEEAADKSLVDLQLVGVHRRHRRRRSSPRHRVAKWGYVV